MMLAPPLIRRTVRWYYHAVTALGGCACDPDLALDVTRQMDRKSVPPGLRCRHPLCRREVTP